jgi:drug/metabolite transporter (DMT)-like permease
VYTPLHPRSTFYGLESFTWLKLAGLLMSFGGTVMVGLADRSSSGGKDNTLWGDVLCLLAAIM